MLMRNNDVNECRSEGTNAAQCCAGVRAELKVLICMRCIIAGGDIHDRQHIEALCNDAACIR